MIRRLPLALAASVLIALPATAVAAKSPLHPGGAVAAKKSTKKKSSKKATKAPVIKKISPRNAKVGDTLTITGKNFVRGKGKNQVFFYTTKGGGTFTKAADASSTRLKVVIPKKLAALLPANGDNARILLRVKGKRLGARTKTKISPLIAINPDDVGGDNSGAGGNVGPTACTPKPSDPVSDIDKDLLSDAREKELTLDACNRDSDGDGASDGYEYYSAIDLNSQALPYPFKTPYPNPLFADANVDFDGDGLTLWDEYSLWTKYGQSQVPLNYSDGKQATQPEAAPDPSGPLFYLDMNHNGVLSDDERDADGDALSNWDESHGRMTALWWKTAYDGTNGVLETPYTVTYGPVSMLDPDSDGDGVLDGADDTDFDGLSNGFEVERPSNWPSTYVAIGYMTSNYNVSTNLADADPTDPDQDAGFSYYSRVQPFNPCKPVWSGNCHIHWPFGHYADDEPWQGWGRPGAGQVIPAPGVRPGDV